MKFSKIIFPAILLLAVAPSPQAGAAEAEEQQRLEAEELALAREEMRAAQSQLRQAQAEMREASRALVQAQREMMKGPEFAGHGIAPARLLDFPNRAMIGVIMGGLNDENGVTVIGLTPGGPAEAAGIQKGDIITGVNGRAFNVADDTPGTDIIKEEISSVEPGDEIQLNLQRNGTQEIVTLTTEARESLTVHSMIRIPEAPEISEQVLRVIEQIRIPEVERGSPGEQAGAH